MGVISVFLLIALFGISFLAYKFRSKINYYEKKYSNVIDIDKKLQQSIETKEKVDKSIENLRTSYKEKKAIFDRLVMEAAIYDEEIELADLGFYKPHFDFDTSEEFKQQIKVVKAKQKQMVSNKAAIECNTEWTVEGSKAKGRKMTNRGIKLTARAFNNECDAAIYKIRWNNANRMEKRIKNAYKAINKLNESNNIVISPEYLELKLKELRLTHEHKEKKATRKGRAS